MAGNINPENEFARFNTLSDYERAAIILRSTGKSWPETTANINAEFSLTYSEVTVRQWFMPGGRLESAFDEYNDMMAEQAIKNAKQAAKKLQTAAIATMGEMMGAAHDDTIRLTAARALANKYVPDRQVTVTEPGESELPPDLQARGDEIAGQPDDPPQSAADDSGVGGDTDPGLPAEVLQQPDDADRPGDTPA